MPTFLLIAPVFLIGAILFFQAPMTSTWVTWMVPFVFYCILVLIFKAQINFLWYSKFPPKLDKAAQAFLNQYFPYYRNLDEPLKRKFDARLTLFNHDKEYISKELPVIPGDVMLLTAASAIQTTFGLNAYLLKHWGQIVLYRQPFHSPHRQYFHSGEVHYDDGCVILAVDPMINGIQKPQNNYHIGLHQFGLALEYEMKIEKKDFFFLETNDFLGSEDEFVMIELSKIRGWEDRFEQIYKDIPPEELFGVCVEHFFNAPKAFELHLPKMYQAIKGILNQDPQNSETPSIHPISEEGYKK